MNYANPPTGQAHTRETPDTTDWTDENYRRIRDLATNPENVDVITIATSLADTIPNATTAAEKLLTEATQHAANLDLPLASIIDAYRAALLGEYEPIRRYRPFHRFTTTSRTPHRTFASRPPS
jgi:hypothetical protein